MTTNEQDTQLSDALLEALQSALRTHAGQPPHSATARAWLLRDALGSAPVLESLLRWADSQHEAGALQEPKWRTLHDLLHELLEDATVNTAPGGLAAAAFSPPPPAAVAPRRIRTAAVPEASTAHAQGLLTDPVIEPRTPSRSEPRSAPEPDPAAGAESGSGPASSSLTEVAAKLARTGAGEAGAGTGAPQSITTRPVGPSPTPSMIEGRYQLIREVHRGQRSSIWQASVTDGVANNPPGRSRTFVAVRLTPAELQITDTDTDADFGRLSRVSAHPALLTLLSQGREGDWAYQVQAWIEGQTLETRLRENISSLDAGLELPAWIRQLAGALETLHEADFVHGDVKPANVIIRPDGRACLVDLDVVRVGSVTGERRALTPAFASPEALAGAPADPRDDVYSLAVLAFRVLSGYLPYGGSGSLSDGHPLPPPSRPQGLDDAQWHALRQALEPVRELRTASPIALADALWPAAGPTSAPWVIGPRSARVRPSHSRRWSRVAMGAAAMAAVAVGAAMMAQPDGVPTPSWMPDLASLLRAGDQQQVTRSTGDPSGEAATAGGAADMAAPQEQSEGAMADAAEEDLATLPGSPLEPVVERDDAGLAEAEVYVPPMGAAMLEQATAGTGAQAPPDTGTDPTPAETGAEAPSPTPPAPAAAASPPAQTARQTYSFPASRIQFGGMAPAALVPVRRQGPLQQRAEIRFAIDPGSARPDEDFMPPPNNIAVFEPGQAETLIIVPLIRSVEQRTTRSFWIQLRTPGNLTGEFPEIQVVLPPVD